MTRAANGRFQRLPVRALSAIDVSALIPNGVTPKGVLAGTATLKNPQVTIVFLSLCVSLNVFALEVLP